MRHEKDNLRLAVLVILGTVFTLSFGDALIKLLSAEMVLWQIFVLRSLVALPLLGLILKLRYPLVAWRPQVLGWTLLRSALLAAMWVVYYAALPYLELSIAAAAYYTLPLFIVLFSAVLLNESVTRMGGVAVLVGFVGVLLILRPATDAFNVYALLPLLAAILYALAMILTRSKCRDEHPLILSGVLNLSFIAVGLAGTHMGGLGSSFLDSSWVPMGGTEILSVGLLGLGILVASIGTAVAYQKGKASVIATFDFAYVGFAVVWGLLFFAEVPDALACLGIGLVVVGGLLSVRSSAA